MLQALLTDLIQRSITLNKYSQRKNLTSLLTKTDVRKGDKTLDFGCGTGLFATTFRKHGLHYSGYDIDKESITFAQNKYKDCYFTTSKKEISEKAPFDLILANCCFHHIDDDLLTQELKYIKGSLKNNGIFIMIDILAEENDSSAIHRWFTSLEKGKHVRSENGYRSILEQTFEIIDESFIRQSLFSLKGNFCPIYTDLITLTCVIS